ncbi:MAG: hypothetical protein ACI4RC_01815 [Oscillospiraceae bacterium]
MLKDNISMLRDKNGYSQQTVVCLRQSREDNTMNVQTLPLKKRSK